MVSALQYQSGDMDLIASHGENQYLRILETVLGPSTQVDLALNEYLLQCDNGTGLEKQRHEYNWRQL